MRCPIGEMLYLHVAFWRSALVISTIRDASHGDMIDLQEFAERVIPLIQEQLATPNQTNNS